MQHYTTSAQRRIDKKHETTLRSFDLLDGRELNFRPSESKRGFYRDAAVLSSDITEGFRMRFKPSDRRMSKSILFPNTPRQAHHEVEEDQLTLSVSCALHLGVLNDARQLPCDHAFCLSCLETLIKSTMSPNIQCPVCCMYYPVPSQGPSGWPPARLHNNIADILRTKRPLGDRVVSQSTANLHNYQREIRRRGSILQKADLVKSLYGEVRRNGENSQEDKTALLDDLKRLIQQMESEETPASLSGVSSNISSTWPTPNTERRKSSIDRKYQLQSEKEVMKKCCSYQMRRNKKIPSMSSSNVSGSTHSCLENPSNIQEIVEEARENLVCGHISLVKGKTNHIFTDPQGNIVIHTSRRKPPLTFRPFLGHGSFQPMYLKLFHESIFISGTVSIDARLQYYCVVRCDMTGKLLARSQDYRLQCIHNEEHTTNEHQHHLLLGFDIDASGERIFLAKPATFEIVILNIDLEETSRVWSFEDDHLLPTYLCYCHKTNELWVTCLPNNTLFCLNVNSNDYYAFEGEKLFHASPTHIVCTTDCRVIFLDEKEGRTFWVSNSCHCLCIQRLSLGPALKSFKPKLLQAVDDSRIMLADEKHCYIGRPTRNLEMRREACCPVS